MGLIMPWQWLSTRYELDTNAKCAWLLTQVRRILYNNQNTLTAWPIRMMTLRNA